jgi:hypothetical protein
VFTGAGSYATPTTFVNGLIPAVATAAVVLAVGAIIALAIPALRRVRVPATNVPVAA